jgi:hypothetical protein
MAAELSLDSKAIEDLAGVTQIKLFYSPQTLKWLHDTQHNDTQHNDIQHDDTQHDDTHHNGFVCDTQDKRHST